MLQLTMHHTYDIPDGSARWFGDTSCSARSSGGVGVGLTRKRLKPMPFPNDCDYSLPSCLLRVWLWIGANAGRCSHVLLRFVLPAPPPYRLMSLVRC